MFNDSRAAESRLRELEIRRVQAAYKTAENELKSLETMDTKQLLKFIASKLIAIDEKLSTINSL